VTDSLHTTCQAGLMQRTRYILLILISVLAVLLTGCAAMQTARAEVEDPWGVVTVPRGEPIRLLSVTALDETVVGGEGLEQLRGVQIAANRRIIGFEVEVIERDGGCEVGRASGRAVNDTLNKRIAAAVGYSCSTACNAAVATYENAHFTMVSPACGAADLVDPVLHSSAFLRLAADDTVEARLAAQFAYEQLGARRAVIIHDGTLETSTHLSAFDAAFTALGGTIAGVLRIEQGTESFGTTLSQAALHNPDVIYAPLLLPDSVRLARERGMSTAARAALLGGRRMASDEFIEQAGAQAEGVYAITPLLDSERADDLARVYETRFDTPPTSTAFAFGYDAASLILDAIEEIAVVMPDGSLQFGRKALQDALHTTAAYPGVTGQITCSEWGDCSAGALAVQQVRRGEWTAVYIP